MSGTTRGQRENIAGTTMHGHGTDRYMLVGADRPIYLRSFWKRRKDGKVYEVVWMQNWEGPRIQLRPEGATNLKHTHWIDPENLLRLYDGWIPAPPEDRS